MNPSNFLKNTIKRAIKDSYDLDVEKVFLEHPDNKSLGDYATNVAFKISQSVHHSPMEVANNICYRIADYDPHEEVGGVRVKILDSVKAVEPGFINLVLTREWLIYVLNSILSEQNNYGSSEKNGKKIMVEYTDPNPFKVFHVGHLMTNTIGESLARLWEFSGYETKRANYQGDVGMHVAKSIWGMEKKMYEESKTIDDLRGMSLVDKMTFLGQSYSLGATAYTDDEEAAGQMKLLNSYVFVAAQKLLQETGDWCPIIDYKNQIPDFDETRLNRVKELYEAGRSWSLEHFEELYTILGTKFDFYYFESQVGELGYEVVKKALESGIFKTDGGAVIFEGEQYGLHTRVFINSFGLPTYEAKELGLAKKKYDDFNYDRSIVVTGNEIEAYFRVLLKAIELVYPELSGKIMHIPHGMMKLSSGKMSSRTGKIVSGVDLLKDVMSAVKDRVIESGIVPGDEVDDISTKIAVGAIKYGILKNGIGKDVVYDKEASLEMTGNTGAYLQYSYVRASSVLEKSLDQVMFDEAFMHFAGELSNEEMELLRTLYMFPDIVSRATQEFAPNYICTYLFDLSQIFNRFYSAHPILDVEDNITRKFRLCLTKAFSIVLRNGLFLLGIDTVSKM